MDSPKNNSVTIIGCGIAGCVLALLLARKGIKVEIYERLSHDEICDVASKRSYNLTFLSYGIELMKTIEIWDIIEPHLIELKGSTTQIKKNAKPIFTPVYHKDKQYSAINRALLLQVVLAAAKKNPLITLHFESALVTIQREEKIMYIQNTKTKHISPITCEVIFGADGVNSLVRAFAQQGQETNHSQEYASWSYKQFVLSKERMEQLNLDARVVHSWTRQNSFIISIPNENESLSALLILPKDKTGYSSFTSPAVIELFLEENYPSLSSAKSEIAQALYENPIGTFVTIHTSPWYYKDFIAILGDAAHGFYPFFGQGTSAAFGDCIALLKLIDQYGTDWNTIFPIYQEQRKRHMDALGELSKEGLIIYRRNRKADYHAIYITLEMMAHKLLPKFIHPPVFLPAMNDPDHTDDYVQKYKKQKRLAHRLGFTVLVSLLTKMVALHEDTIQSLKKIKKL